MPRGSRPGERRGGRVKGTPNACTVEIKAAIERAFEGIGGVPALTAWAQRNPDLFYARVWTKILPRELSADLRAEVTTNPGVRMELINRIVSMIAHGETARGPSAL